MVFLLSCAKSTPLPSLPKQKKKKTKNTSELVYGISVYSVELLSMFKCLKDFFACQDERSFSCLSITKRPRLLSSPVWGCMKDRLHIIGVATSVTERWDRGQLPNEKRPLRLRPLLASGILVRYSLCGRPQHPIIECLPKLKLSICDMLSRLCFLHC